MEQQETKRIFAKNLKAVLTRNGVTQAELAEMMDVAYSSVSSWCNGVKIPRMDKIEWIANHFNIRKSDLIEEREDLPQGLLPFDLKKIHRIPILGRIAAGTPIYAQENIEGYTYTELNNGAEYFGLRVIGVPDKYVMEEGGWSTDYVLKNNYQHTLSDGQKNAIKKRDEFFNAICNTICNTKKGGG